MKGRDLRRSVVVTILVSDYRKVGNIRCPHQMKVAFQDKELSVKVEELVLNAEIPAEKLALPESVKELLTEDKAK